VEKPQKKDREVSRLPTDDAAHISLISKDCRAFILRIKKLGGDDESQSKKKAKKKEVIENILQAIKKEFPTKINQCFGFKWSNIQLKALTESEDGWNLFQIENEIRRFRLQIDLSSFPASKAKIESGTSAGHDAFSTFASGSMAASPKKIDTKDSKKKKREQKKKAKKKAKINLKDLHLHLHLLNSPGNSLQSIQDGN